MHEMALTENVVDIVLKHAEMAQAKKVLYVRLKIGELRDIVHHMMEKCFRFVARETIAAEVVLEIVKIPIVVRCTACGQEKEESIDNFAQMKCQHCESTELELVKGNEFFIEDIEII